MRLSIINGVKYALLPPFSMHKLKRHHELTDEEHGPIGQRCTLTRVHAVSNHMTFFLLPSPELNPQAFWNIAALTWLIINKFGQLIDASFQPFFDLLPHFRNLKKNALPTNQPTGRRTDRPSYRDARTHLKSGSEFFYYLKFILSNHLKIMFAERIRFFN